jgi:peroxin-16
MTGQNSSKSVLRDPIGAFNELYASFLFANASRLSKVESTARSLTWFVPAQSLSSEALFTALNLLTLYHDALSNRTPYAGPASSSPGLPATSSSSATSMTMPVSAHARYTKYWLRQSKLYKATARLLSVISYAQLLVEMAGKKYKGEQGRWSAVIALESIK